MATYKWKEENQDKLRAYRRAYYYKNRQSHYDRNEKTQNEIKQFIQESKDKCIICGETEKICLDFHHLRDKKDNIAFVHNYGSMKRAKEEVSKCVVLCSNCHRKVHAGIINTDIM